ncbi:MAG: DUF2652 domain-containing protein [Chloroflexi bacterium]|nr:MAG: DUF2652 domain-containing protein [Chloroflexota bacterium]MBL1195372.1 DUF2652 domain-containing protein [Chloroflexota bacterium]NOH12656.1 DUF2652 domain-containing protein [Chloroflexota bacterium]
MAENGFIIVADITGYTAYLSGSELEHAQEILESLLNTILKEIHPPLTISRTEGDAVISYSLGNAFIMGQTLLEMLEQIYCAFHTELEHSDRNTTCPCDACQNMHQLDLKFVTHFGEFGLQKLGNMTEMVGSDVNLTHRLLKNHIPEKTGINAYAYFTQAAIDVLKLNEMTSVMKEHSESYDHLGEVHGWAYDLKPVWQRNRERLRVVIRPEEAAMSFNLDLPVSVPVAWDYINSPEHRARYRFSDTSKVSGNHGGRLDVGTTYHCIHGDNVSDETILDWRPFDYLTIEGQGRFGPIIFKQRFSAFVKESGDGTNYQVHFTRIYNDENSLHALALRVMYPFMKSEFQQGVRKGLAEISQMIEEDRQSGRLKMVEISAAAATA